MAAAAAAETAKEAVEESVVLLAAQRLACAAPFLAAALLRWVVAHAQLEVLEREIAQQAEHVVAAKASCHKHVLNRAGAAVVLEQPSELSTVSGLDAVLAFLSEELGTWRPLHHASSPSLSPVRLGRADDADANAADADAADADNADADAAPPRTGGRGAGTSTSHRLSITAREEAAAAAAAAAQDAQLAEVFRQLGAEAATRPSLGALRPSEREGPLWLSGDSVWAVLRGGLLGLFRTPDGRAPEDLAARCALWLDLRLVQPAPLLPHSPLSINPRCSLRLDLRLAVVELAALDLDLDLGSNLGLDAWQPAAAPAAAPAPAAAAGSLMGVAVDNSVGGSADVKADAAVADAVAADAAVGGIGSWRAVCRAVGRSLQVHFLPYYGS